MINKPTTKNLIIPIAVIIAGVSIAGVIFYLNYSKCPEPINGTLTEDEILSSQEVGEKVIDFINQNILGGKATASLNEILKENKMYKIKFTIEGQEIETYVTLDGEILFPKEAAIDLAEQKTIGSFLISEDKVCKEEGKPIVYFFGSEGCPHCGWEHPLIEEVAAKFGEEIVFHNNTGPETDMDIFSKYSGGGVPALVLGCKYYRVGSGENTGEEEEIKNLTALICKLTENKPDDVCSPVQDLINQIES